MLKAIPKDYFDPANNTLKLLWEEEWRGLGITQVQEQYTRLSRHADLVLEPWLGALRGPRT